MIYRMGNTADLPALRRLYHICFPEDGVDYMDAFFSLIQPETMAVCGEVDGEIVSALYLLPATTVNGIHHLPVKYLYAGATLPAHRGCGYYGQLLSFAQNISKSTVAAIYLRPANTFLFDYYADFGYRPLITITDRAGEGYHFQPDDAFLSLFRQNANEIAAGEMCTVVSLYTKEYGWLEGATTTWIGE